METEIKKLVIKGSTDTCPSCGYTDGFHVSFQDHIDKLRIILICPECHSRFNSSWEIPRSVEQRFLK